MNMPNQKETLGFQAEVKELLHLVVHSLYSNREIFLRELISNASDACDKLRFEAIDHPALYEGDSELKIQVTVDPKARTLTISDNGIGMSREEAVSHLGTIARSGTKEFFGELSKTDKANRSELIGQFGVGFYSAFIVAEKVTVISRRAGLPADQAVQWVSDGTGAFSVEKVRKSERGTDVILSLRTDTEEELEGTQNPLTAMMSGEENTIRFGDFLEHSHLRQIICRYSDHISLPIFMKKQKWDETEKNFKSSDEWEKINQSSALWARPKSEITPEQYQDFFSGLSPETQDPLIWTHNKVEGSLEYTQLLCIPSRAPFDLWDSNAHSGVRLYVQRVFIMDDVRQFLPTWLRFVRGIIDSSDLPLNVSRELIQRDRNIKAIKESNTKRALGMLEDLSKNHPEKYQKFWVNFGQVLKEGVMDNAAERIIPLLRFVSTESEKKGIPSAEDFAEGKVSNYWMSLADYVKRMKPGQEKIYYLTAPSLEAARNSPHLEVFRQRGIEVLLLTDRVDEWLLNFLTEFEKHSLASVARGDFKISELEKPEGENEKEDLKSLETGIEPILKKMKEALGDQVKSVRATFRLTDSVACLVSDEGDISAHLERLLKQMNQNAPTRKPILEINPKHPLIAQLKENSPDLEDWAHVFFCQALLAEGAQLPDPAGFVRRVNKLLDHRDEASSIWG